MSDSINPKTGMDKIDSLILVAVASIAAVTPPGILLAAYSSVRLQVDRIAASSNEVVDCTAPARANHARADLTA